MARGNAIHLGLKSMMQGGSSENGKMERNSEGEGRDKLRSKEVPGY